MSETQREAQEFAEAVKRGEYGQCVPLEQVRAIYQDGFAAGWAQGQERMKERMVGVSDDGWSSCKVRALRALPLEPSPVCPMPEREEEPAP